VTQVGSRATAGVSEGDILADKYRVERVLGRGGMGVVVAAHHIQLDEKVALKFLLPEALENAETVARFGREARAAVKIKSEHVARVIDVGTLPNGAPYMVMEYLEGEDLADWLRNRGPMPVEQAVEFVLQACVAVADAHALGIVHRDLKPANLFCVRRSDGQLSIKVLDFGISKMTGPPGSGPGVAITRTASLMGTPLYMSPEQMRSSRDVDAKTDIWALGAILFELMAARPAFLAVSLTELAIKVNNDPAPSIRSLRQDVPDALDAIIFRCLEKDPRARFRNVAELALALLPFAPKRAKAAVERISGIIQAAGLSASAVDVPASVQVAEERASAGTLPPFGRTTSSNGDKKKSLRGAAIAGAVALAALLGTVFLVTRGSTQHDDPPRPAAVQASATPVPLAKPEPATEPKADPKPAESASVAAAVQAPPVATAAPPEATARKKVPMPPSTPGSATPRRSPPAAVSAPAAANCDPPYYFDAKGSRLFKPECL
jgi:serine/threonine-protein kinase